MVDSKEDWYPKKMVGTNAENLIETLINSSPDWECHKYGIENHINTLKDSLKENNKSEVSRKIRAMPDLVAINKKTNQVLLIEVKFRGFIDCRDAGTELYEFGYGQIKDYTDFWPEAYLVIVHQKEPFFRVIKLKDIEWHKHFYSRKENDGKINELWNFIGIRQSFSEIFPNIPEKVMESVIKQI